MLLLPDLGRLSLASTGVGVGGGGGKRREKLPRATPFLNAPERETFFSMVEKASGRSLGNWRDTGLTKAFEALIGGWRGMYAPKPDTEIFTTIERFFEQYLAPLGVNASAPRMDRLTAFDLVHYYVNTWSNALWELSKKDDFDEYAIRDEEEVDHLFETIALMVQKHAEKVPGWNDKTWKEDVKAMRRLFIGRKDDRQQRFAAGTTFYDLCMRFENTYLKPFNIYGEALQKYSNRFGPEQLMQLFFDWTAATDRYVRVHNLRDS